MAKSRDGTVGTSELATPPTCVVQPTHHSTIPQRQGSHNEKRRSTFPFVSTRRLISISLWLVTPCFIGAHAHANRNKKGMAGEAIPWERVLIPVRPGQIFLGIFVQAPFLAVLLRAVSMNAKPIQPSSTLAYLEPSHLNGSPACHFRTSASKQRCRRA